VMSDTCTDAYSVKHITYKWQDGPTKSVSLADDVQLPQVLVKGYRVKEKLEVLSTGVCRSSFNSSQPLAVRSKQKNSYRWSKRYARAFVTG